MKRLILIVLLLLPAILYSQPREDSVLITGYDWENLSYNEKATFLAGFMNGMFAAGYFEVKYSKRATILKTIPYDITMDQIMDLIDDYYIKHPEVLSAYFMATAFSVMFRYAQLHNSPDLTLGGFKNGF